MKFTGIVFVGCSFDAIITVQVFQHGRVNRNLINHISKITQYASSLYIIYHNPISDKAKILINSTVFIYGFFGGYKMVLPKKRKFIYNRRIATLLSHHVYPPMFVIISEIEITSECRVIRRIDVLLPNRSFGVIQINGRRWKIVNIVDKSLDSEVSTHARKRSDFCLSWSHGSSTEQMGCLCHC